MTSDVTDEADLCGFRVFHIRVNLLHSPHPRSLAAKMRIAGVAPNPSPNASGQA
jgi:hypothetical protein